MDKKKKFTESQVRAIREKLLFCLDPRSKDEISGMSTPELVDAVYRAQCKSRYLLVIEDVPSVMIWEFLGLAFPDENINDSRLIITTRNPVVAKHLTGSVLQMKPLSHDESWEILTSKFQLPVTDDAPGTS